MVGKICDGKTKKVSLGCPTELAKILTGVPPLGASIIECCLIFFFFLYIYLMFF
jgi:hypothetical protein